MQTRKVFDTAQEGGGVQEHKALQKASQLQWQRRSKPHKKVLRSKGPKNRISVISVSSMVLQVVVLLCCGTFVVPQWFFRVLRALRAPLDATVVESFISLYGSLEVLCWFFAVVYFTLRSV